MKKLGLALLLAVLGLAPAQAQNFTMPPPAGVTVGGFVVVASCGGQSLTATQGFGTMDATGKLCVNASVSASVTGFPTIQTTGTPISVTTGGVTGTLPTGAVVVASNVGATNGAYCKLGASATTSDQLIPPNSWFAFTVGANTQLTCITSTSTTTVNMVGGSGLPTGSGGGGGGSGGGGAITAASGSYAAGAFSAGVAVSGSWLDGAIVSLGAKADAHSCSSASAIACLGQIDDDVKGSVAAGTARIGYTSDDVCSQKAKTNLAISQNGTSSVQLIALSGATVIYVCSLSLIAAGATTVALTTGTGSACVTGNAAVIGTTTANIANSLSFAANGGLTLGNGAGTIAAGAASSELCMILGTNVFVSGNLTYVQQ